MVEVIVSDAGSEVLHLGAQGAGLAGPVSEMECTDPLSDPLVVIFFHYGQADTGAHGEVRPVFWVYRNLGIHASLALLVKASACRETVIAEFAGF